MNCSKRHANRETIVALTLWFLETDFSLATSTCRSIARETIEEQSYRLGT